MKPPELKPAFRDYLLEQYKGQSLLESLEQDRYRGLRYNSARKYQLKFKGGQIPWCEKGVTLALETPVSQDPAFHLGAYYVQDPNAMFLEWMLSDLEVESPNMLDLCAAPGGKSTHLLSLYPNGFLVANEPISKRLNVLRENLEKWGSSNFMITQNEARDFNKTEFSFDLVLVDAPCSGTGMFRKMSGFQEQWSREQVQYCANRQMGILDSAKRMVKPEGFLLYVTCAFDRNENEWQIEELLKEGGFNLVNPKSPIPKGVLPTGYGYRLYPGNGFGEGQFFALLQREGRDKGADRKPNEGFNLAGTSKIQIVDSDRVPPFLRENFTWQEEYGVFQSPKAFHLVPYFFETRFHNSFGNLNVRALGTELWRAKEDRISPMLSLASVVNCQFPVLNFKEEEALEYVKGESKLPGSDPQSASKTGWFQLQYGQLPMGIGKKVGNRINNRFPKAWRLT